MCGNLTTLITGVFVWLSNLPPLFYLSLLALFVAFWGVLTQRTIARRSSTLNYIIRQESDSDIIRSKKIFIKCARKGNINKWAKASREGKKKTQAIRTILNEFELISIGIQKGIIDFDMYRRWNKTGTRQFWRASKPFIDALRDRNDDDLLYYEFEQLVGWLKDNKTPRRNRWLGYFF